MRQRWVMGNWKMNGDQTQIKRLLAELVGQLSTVQQERCVVFPPALYIPMVAACLESQGMHWGAQNVYPQSTGAYTGELSGSMFREFGCDYVLVGHSERRHLLGESESFVAKKFHHVKDHDMIPVLCVGETLEERRQGLTNDVVAKQLLAVTLDKTDVFHHCIIAYEPVWAIGTGQTATAEQAQAVHEHIRQVLAMAEPNHAANVPILYGGSVTAKNAAALFSMPDVDGGLVGGASLDARQFVEIVKCIS